MQSYLKKEILIHDIWMNLENISQEAKQIFYDSIPLKNLEY